MKSNQRIHTSLVNPFSRSIARAALSYVLLMQAVTLTFAGQTIIHLSFDDPAGTPVGVAADMEGFLTGTTDTGAGAGNYLTNGSMAVLGAGQIEPVGNAGDGSFYKPRTFAAPVSAADWDRVTLSVVVDFAFTNTATKGAKGSFSLLQSVEGNAIKVAEIGVQHLTNDQGRPQYLSNNGGNSTFVPDPLWGLSQTGVVLSVTVDFAAGQLTFSYDVGAGPVAYFSEPTTYTYIDALRIVGAKSRLMDEPGEYIKFHSLTLSGDLKEGAVWGAFWNGYLIGEDGWVDTGTWAGRIHTAGDPWLYSESMGSWMQVPSGQNVSAGGWFYLLNGAVGGSTEAGNWHGLTVLEGGLVDAGNWLGWVYVGSDPWVYAYDIDSWMYIVPGQSSHSGIWAYIFK